MSEPIKLYNVKTGEELIMAAPTTAKEMVASGEWTREAPALVEIETPEALVVIEPEAAEEQPTGGEYTKPPEAVKKPAAAKLKPAKASGVIG
jgi:hypothetical protein